MFDWDKFWSGFDDDPDKIKDVEGLIFQKKNGEWFMVVSQPNGGPLMSVRVYFNPWTGEELPKN